MKLKKRVRFTCVASCYRTKDVHCEKGWSVILNEDDFRVLKFRNRSFKEEHLPPLPVAEEKPAKIEDGDKKQTGDGVGDDHVDGSGEGDSSVAFPLGETGLDKVKMEMLEKAGFKDAKDILEVGAEGLKSINGIGEKTAAEIIKLCEKAVGEKVQAND